jgi:hypothetical protein
MQPEAASRLRLIQVLALIVTTTTAQPSLFNLHDSPVRAISFVGADIDLEFEFGNIERDHPANPTGIAQIVRPCALHFSGVSGQNLKVWDELTKSFVSHPEPQHPIDGDVIKYEAVTREAGYEVHIEGFHKAGWVEWNFDCKEITVSWSEFAGKAWYER